ncbi:E3 ubiquitin-protein ligase rnf213-alpha [Lachnellula subtilissima]|uniref:E3 ubiquitin-protein ligase rnf213-alpha n=1 Tax=Lachnellula subtilissima TaxID=602034 RepID=A0A8H8U873_9HELO|nr:E3 ubiquitin-protein ligase rnf213-alpha [Lachnellula subtilissima]
MAVVKARWPPGRSLSTPPPPFPPSNPFPKLEPHLTQPTDPQAAKIGKEYEARGGDYTNEPGSKDKPQKGPPVKKSPSEKKSETAKVSSSHNLQQPSNASLHPNINSDSDSNIALPLPKPACKRKITLVLRLKRPKATSTRQITRLCDVPSGERGSVPGTAYVPMERSPLRKVRNRSDSSTQQESGPGSGSEKAPSRGRPSGGAKKGKEVKEPKKGERSSARQAGKKAENVNANGEAHPEKASRGKKRKNETDDDDNASVSSKKSKKDN